MNQILLNNSFAQVALIELTQEQAGFNGLKIIHKHCTASLSLYGGHVLSYVPTGHKDVFWLSKDAIYQPGKAIRGGVPLCWPWFGPFTLPKPLLSEKSNLAALNFPPPNHGFARQLPWIIESVNADEKGVTIVLLLTGTNQHPLWPNAYKIMQTLFFGEKFTQVLAMQNLSDEDAFYSAAMHSYFRVSNPDNISIDALTGVSYNDKVNKVSDVQRQAVSCVGEIDRVYHSGEKMSLVDRQWQRIIKVTSTNCQQWVLWNPGAELANSMTDVHLNGEQEYVCLEAANTEWQALPAGKVVTISQEVKVTKL